jgi:hypothetical protein
VSWSEEKIRLVVHVTIVVRAAHYSICEWPHEHEGNKGTFYYCGKIGANKVVYATLPLASIL